MVLRKIITTCLLALVSAIAVPFANADAIANYTVSGYNISADLNNSGVLAVEITNVSGATGYVQGFSLQLFSSNIAGATFGTPDAYTLSGGATASNVTLSLTSNAQANNSANGVNTCDSTGAGFGSVCDVLTGGFIQLQTGQDVAFFVNIDSGGASLMDTSQWHLISNATGNSDGTGGNVYAISASPGTAPVPEPSSLALLGSGLAGIAGLYRRCRAGRN